MQWATTLSHIALRIMDLIFCASPKILGVPKGNPLVPYFDFDQGATTSPSNCAS